MKQTPDHRQITCRTRAGAHTVSSSTRMSEERLVIDMSFSPTRPPLHSGSTAASRCLEPEITSTTVERNSPSVRSTRRRGILKNKPKMSYVSMIMLAINSVPERQLTLSQIYEYMKRRWSEAFDSHYVGWKNSVRHNLSLNDCFIKVPKGIGDSGKGHKWTLQHGWQSMFEKDKDSYKRRPRGSRQTIASKESSRPIARSEESVCRSSAQREGGTTAFAPVFPHTSFYAQSASGESVSPSSPQ